MTIIPLEVQVDVSLDGSYDVQLSQEETYNIGLGEKVEVQTIECLPGNGLIIQNKTISIDPELILDCGTSTTVLHGGVT